MLRKNAFRAASIAALVALMSLVSGCASDTEETKDAGTSSQSNVKETEAKETQSDKDTDGNDDRAFNSTDDAVIEAAETTLKSQNAKAEWAGKTLRVTLDGSVDDPTAHLPCLGMEALVAGDEDVTLVFSDGELICAER